MYAIRSYYEKLVKSISIEKLAGLALLLCAAYSTYWVADQQVKELGDIDSAILADELPIGAFSYNFV